MELKPIGHCNMLYFKWNWKNQSKYIIDQHQSIQSGFLFNSAFETVRLNMMECFVESTHSHSTQTPKTPHYIPNHILQHCPWSVYVWSKHKHWYFSTLLLLALLVWSSAASALIKMSRAVQEQSESTSSVLLVIKINKESHLWFNH
jgi:hypothetical protein